VQLNGKELAVAGNGDLPRLAGLRTAAGQIQLAPATITFLALPAAGNAACR
jgi:heparanase